MHVTDDLGGAGERTKLVPDAGVHIDAKRVWKVVGSLVEQARVDRGAQLVLMTGEPDKVTREHAFWHSQHMYIHSTGIEFLYYKSYGTSGLLETTAVHIYEYCRLRNFRC